MSCGRGLIDIVLSSGTRFVPRVETGVIAGLFAGGQRLPCPVVPDCPQPATLPSRSSPRPFLPYRPFASAAHRQGAGSKTKSSRVRNAWPPPGGPTKCTAWPQVRKGDVRVVEHSQNAEPLGLKGPPLGAGMMGTGARRTWLPIPRARAPPLGTERQWSTFECQKAFLHIATGPTAVQRWASTVRSSASPSRSNQAWVGPAKLNCAP